MIMIKLDITDRWPALSASALDMERAVLDIYGAAKVEIAPWPYARLTGESGQTIGYIQIYGFPRITVEDERTYLELSPIVLPFGPRAWGDMREKLATEAHARWAVEMGYLFQRRGVRNADGSITVTPDYVQYVDRLCSLPYAQLTDVEKAHARSEADRIMELFDPKLEG